MKNLVETTKVDLKNLHLLLKKNTAGILDVVKNCSQKDIENVRKFIGLNRTTFHKHRIENINLIQHMIITFQGGISKICLIFGMVP